MPNGTEPTATRKLDHRMCVDVAGGDPAFISQIDRCDNADRFEKYPSEQDQLPLPSAWF
jgi:hypothetical protein